tara:strand:+ start:39 stop:1754 length:1716 start_codon:yes stop_codon:yes gene_type:complete
MADQKIADITASINETNQKVESSDKKLAAISKVLSLESKQEKKDRKAAKKRENDAKKRHEKLLKEQKEGNATAEEVEESSKDLAKATEDSAEASLKRSMFDRFAGDDKPGVGGAPGASGGEGGGEEGGGFMKKFGGFFKLIKGFVGILAVAIIPALAYFMNDPEIFAKMKEYLFDFIDGVAFMIDKFGLINTAILGLLGVLAIFNPFTSITLMKTIFLAIKGALMTGLTALSTFLGIAILPLVAIIAAVAVVGYALYDTFLEVKKAFDEGASVGELIRVAFVQFFGAFGKLLDFAKNMIADVLAFFGFEDLAKIFKEFSFEKVFEDFFGKVFDNGEKLIKSFVNLFSAVIARVVKFFTDIFDIDFKALFSGILGKAGAVGSKIAGFFGFGGGDDEKTPAPAPAPAPASEKGKFGKRKFARMGIAEREMAESGMDLGDSSRTSVEKIQSRKERNDTSLQRRSIRGAQREVYEDRLRAAGVDEDADFGGMGKFGKRPEFDFTSKMPTAQDAIDKARKISDAESASKTPPPVIIQQNDNSRIAKEQTNNYGGGNKGLIADGTTGRLAAALAGFH